MYLAVQMKDASSAKVIPGSSDINEVLSIIQNMWRVREKRENNVVEKRQINSEEGNVCHKGTDCPPFPFLSTLNSATFSTIDNNFKIVSVMTQTEQENNLFHSSQQLEKESTVINYSHFKELNKQVFVDNSKTKSNVLKAMISFENECEVRLKRQVKQACRIATDATRAEEAIKHRKEIDALLLKLRVQQTMKIEEAVSAERARFKKLSEDLQHEHALWRQEQEKNRSEMATLKYKLDIDRLNLEERMSKLACEEESFINRVLEVESKRKEIERRGLFLNEASAMESRKAQDEARKTYEVTVEAVMLQKEFYDKEIKALQSEKKLLSVARSEIAAQERDTSRLLISLRNENDSLQTRLQAAETQLNEIGSFIGDKKNIVSKCRNLLKYVKSYRNLKEKLSQSHLEIATLHKRVKEESRKLEERLTIVENERLRLQGQNTQLISRINVLENEVNLSRRECTDLGFLLQECHLAFNSLGSSPYSRNENIGWRSIYHNLCTSKLNLSSHDAIGSFKLQYCPPSHKISFKGKFKNSAEGILFQNLGHYNQKLYSVGGKPTAPEEDSTSKNCVVDTRMKIGPLTSGVPSNNSKISSINVTEIPPRDDTKKGESSTLTIENPECEYFEGLDPEINYNSSPHTKPNLDTSPCEAAPLIDEEESMMVPKLKDELQPIYTNTYQGSVDAAFIASAVNCTYKQGQHEDDSIVELAMEATGQAVLPITHSTEFISKPMRFLVRPIPSTGKFEEQTLNTRLSMEEDRKRDPALENISKLHQEKRSQGNEKLNSDYLLDKVDFCAGAFLEDEPQITLRTLSSEKYELCEFEEETNGDATEGTMTRDELQNTSRSQDNHSLSSEKYELCEFEEETKGDVTENLEESRVEGSVTYSMNWSKNDVDNSTAISTEVEESQENGTVSLEIVSTYYESSVDDTDNNW